MLAAKFRRKGGWIPAFAGMVNYLYLMPGPQQNIFTQTFIFLSSFDICNFYKRDILFGPDCKIILPDRYRINGNIDISQINMNNVDHIEIVEGPLSVNYGTDALAGTINIITKKSQKETFSVSSNNYYESTGQYNFSGRIGYRKNKKSL